MVVSQTGCLLQLFNTREVFSVTIFWGCFFKALVNVTMSWRP